MTVTAKILIVDDDNAVLGAARVFLQREFSKIITITDPSCIPEILSSNDIDIILLDMNYSPGKINGEEGLSWIHIILGIDPGIMIIPVTAYGEMDLAVKAMQAGAVDFVVKPWSNQKLLATINSALQLKKARIELFTLKSTRQKLIKDLDQPFSRMIGNSVAMRKIYALIDKVAPTDANVLILGENGTGKELVARALHRKSNRNEDVFITVDLGSLHEGLFESELFGHSKGAFTDAKEERPGRFELACGGSLFLDEVGNLPVALQPKLLSVLQNRKLSRVGSNREVTVDIRLICATNQSMIQLVKKNLFRQDLLFRINTFEIRVPALQERIEDIPLLLDYYMAGYTRKYNKPGLTVSPSAIKALKLYPWPGNVRELQHAVEKAVIITDNSTITEKDFSLGYSRLSETGPDSLNLLENEKYLIISALGKYNGNISKAAVELGIERTALHRRIRKYGI
jgi:DNA-binding NtrC family response regulator